MLFDGSLREGCATQGAISSQDKSNDDNVNLPLRRPLRSGRKFSVPPDKPLEVSSMNEFLDLLLQIVIVLRVITIITVEMVELGFVSPLR